ncbi:ATP-binding protein [Sphingomonas sp. RT2P30]|uniref:ATP-binding protein n=1 Tax=Parasphingomonas halimpatiens TaxID=3096162 RepID=UPI002FC87F33
MLGRLLIILLLTVLVEFSASTLLYERASEFSVREDEARRLAEHLVVASQLIEEKRPAERPAIARALDTDRYHVEWRATAPAHSSFTPDLANMQRQILAWEPGLAHSDLRLRLAPLHDGTPVTGELKLADGSWMSFRMRTETGQWSFAIGRVLRALVPALLLLGLSALLIRSTLRPLRRLIAATRQVGMAESAQVPEAGTAEIRQLIHAFNEMQDRIHDLIDSRTQALAAVSHDLRTPLARLQLRLEAVDDVRLRDELGEDVTEMGEMIASLLAFLAGDDDPEPPALSDLAVIVATLVDNAADRGADATYAGPEHLETVIRASAMRRAVSNLIENALHYAGQARVTLAGTAESGVTLTVADDGPGIPADRIAEVLRPFVRLDDSRARNTKGLGLGLAIVAKVVAGEGGTLSLVNRGGGGLDVTIALPGRGGLSS